MALGSAVTGIDIYMFGEEACWAVVGIAIAAYFFTAFFAHKIFRCFLEGHVLRALASQTNSPATGM